MPSLFCLVVDHAPYGRIEPAEAIRHAGGALGQGWDVVLALMGNSVYTAVPRQSPSAGEFLSLSEALAKLIETGHQRLRVLVDGSALVARGLPADDLIPGVRPVPTATITQALAGCDRALLF